MKIDDVRGYKIQIQGRVEEEINLTSPIQFTIEPVNGPDAWITLQADQSGMIGLIRHLHGMGFVLISIIRI